MTEETSLGRWCGSLAVVLTLHAGAAAGLWAWQNHAPLSAPPPASIMMELAPLPSAPQSPATAKPSAKRQDVVEKPQPKRPDPLPKAPMVEKAEVAVNKPVGKPTEQPPERARPRAEEASAPPAVPAPPSERAAAPAQGASTAPPSNALPTWQGALLAHLEKHKRYPRAAQLRRQQGVSHIAFTVDRQGNVVAQRLHRSAGHDSLDAETLELLQRAQPLPPPPPEVSGDRIDLVVPVQFFLR